MQSKCPRNELHIFSISKAWNELHKQWKKREISPKPLAPMDGRGIKDLHKCGLEMNKNSSLPSQKQQETSELNGSGGGGGKGIRGPRPFVPVGSTNRDKRPPFCPGWCLQPGQKAPVSLAGPASRWTRDKSHLLSRAQRLSGQMTWNKGLFCSSVWTGQAPSKA